jgi:peptide deformylase|tara:strand:- start:6426 stop:6965 length:540 start_codon:yes stop_codon:yes gene_type:complete
MKNELKIVIGSGSRLRTKSVDVSPDEFGEELNEKMEGMIKKMLSVDGVGLSGVQVGDPRRILVATGGLGVIKMVNPEILDKSQEKVFYREGCLSLPGLAVDTERNKSIVVRYKDPFGGTMETAFSDPTSVIIQHEMDHFDGKLLIDKLSSIKRDMYNKKLKKKLRARKRLLKELSKHGY